MSTISAELEQEFANELGFGGGPSPAAELEGPAVQESEAFFNHLAAMADRSGRTQSLRRIAFAAARSAYSGALAKRPTTIIEGESEQAAAAELEHELIAACSAPPREALLPEMEHLGHAASEAETEQEAAEQFLPLIPLAAKFLLPLAAKAAPALLKAGGALAKKVLPKVIAKVAPNLTRGVGNLARTLHRSPLTRNLLRTVPRIAQRTVGNLAQRAARGQRITPKLAGTTLARQAARVLGQPRQAVAAFRRSRLLDRRHHLRARRVLGPPRRGSMVMRSGGGGVVSGGGGYVGGMPLAVPGGVSPVVGGVPYGGVPMVAGGTCCPCPPPATCPSCGR